MRNHAEKAGIGAVFGRSREGERWIIASPGTINPVSVDQIARSRCVIRLAETAVRFSGKILDR
ncbi:MAG: hypothetical protein QHI48_06870 [Bacteroidota bacterium]|nr:hypothetical protein [Bacteroidota bacterium]